ncbi:restriction endonuclease subunit S [Flavobacterium sp.]|uniref:restriction endonuclease subunit S n=1 Tax=Flavobacterium sp. TaxID=239 RepID=UPI0035B4F654
MKRYDSYKDSGIEWIGEIPSHWDSVRLCSLGNFSSSGIDKKINPDEELVKIINFTDIYKNPNGVLDSSIDYMIVSTTPNKKVEHSVVKGDLIFLPSSETYEDLGKSAIVNEEMENVSFSYHVIRLNFTRELAHGFKKYLTNNYQVLNQFSSNGQGTTRKIIGRNVFRNIKIVIPPIEEQTTIANYLDQKTTEIDILIAKKERLIQLLEEERTAIINQAVTKGLDPTVPMKDSGIEWLGEIPAHWEVKRIGHVAKVVRGASPRPAGDPLLFNGDFLPWITVKEVTNAEGKFIVSTETYLTEQGSKNTRIIEPETLLLSNSGATLGVPRITKIKGGINDGSVAFFNLQIERDYLYYFFITHTKIYRDEVSGYGQPNLNTDIIKSTKIALPNKKEQLEIVLFIENYLEKFEFLKYKTQQEIELLKEYKTALISEVVTGKVDVREEKLS